MKLRRIVAPLCFLSLLYALSYSGLIQSAAANEPSRGALVALRAYLKRKPTERAPLSTQGFASVALSREDASAARELLWQDHRARIRRERAAEMKALKISRGKLEMPFFYRVFGPSKRPEGGRRLFISLHGGGGAPKRVNDSQWQNQKRLYRLEEGVYLVPRAPTNTWNLWHQGHIDPMFDRLIENLIVFQDVNPDRVYLMGYSAGGDGVYQLAPRMADRWAAAAMMAGHPNETSPLGLRNLPFTLHMGGRDGAYQRNAVARRWKQQLKALRAADPEGYEHWVEIYPNKGHWMDGKDASALPWMAKKVRRTLPERIVWLQDDVTHGRFYWLAVDPRNRHARSKIVATRSGQRINLEPSFIGEIMLRLNDAMIDLSAPVTVTVDGKRVFRGTPSRTIGVLATTLGERGDPRAVFSAELRVLLPGGP